jgi:hypothetical protein
MSWVINIYFSHNWKTICRSFQWDCDHSEYFSFLSKINSLIKEVTQNCNHALQMYRVLSYSVHMFGHFLSAALLHGLWMTWQATCTWSVSQVVMYVVMLSLTKWEYSCNIICSCTMCMLNTDPTRNIIINSDKNSLMRMFKKWNNFQMYEKISSNRFSYRQEERKSS